MSEQRPTVLVIDDDTVGRTQLCEALRGCSRRLVMLGTPIGASRTVSQEKIDVVVVDVEMPNLTGDKLSRLFRESPRLAHVGVVLVSGRSHEELMDIARRCGADEVVSKREVAAKLTFAVSEAWKASLRRQGVLKPTGVPIILESFPPPRPRG